MLPEEISKLTYPELIDILVKLTGELLTLMHQKEADGITIRNKRLELQMVQTAIENKKAIKHNMQSNSIGRKTGF